MRVPVLNPFVVGGLLELLLCRELVFACRSWDGPGVAPWGAFFRHRTVEFELIPLLSYSYS